MVVYTAFATAMVALSLGRRPEVVLLAAYYLLLHGPSRRKKRQQRRGRSSIRSSNTRMSHRKAAFSRCDLGPSGTTLPSYPVPGQMGRNSPGQTRMPRGNCRSMCMCVQTTVPDQACVVHRVHTGHRAQFHGLWQYACPSLRGEAEKKEDVRSRSQKLPGDRLTD